MQMHPQVVAAPANVVVVNQGGPLVPESKKPDPVIAREIPALNVDIMSQTFLDVRRGPKLC